MLDPLVRALRATGADLPFGRPEAAHPGVALESWFWRFVVADTGTVVLLAATEVREPDGMTWLGLVLAARHPDGTSTVVERVLDDVRTDPRALALTAGSGAGDRLAVTRERLQVDLGADGGLGVQLTAPWRWPRRSLRGPRRP